MSDGTAASIPLAASEDLEYPLTEGESLKVVARAPVSVPAPVVPGQVLGEVCAYLEGEEVASVDLIAAAPSARREEPPARRMWWDSFF